MENASTNRHEGPEDAGTLLADAERLIAEHDARIAVALMKGRDTSELEERAHFMRAALTRLKAQILPSVPVVASVAAT